MRWNQLFVPTLREVPAEAEVTSHRLLLRAGYVRQLGAGIYSYLPLAQRVMLNIAAIIRQEMNRIGGQEFLLPALNPSEVWRESGRWDIMGDNMFRLKDRGGRDMCLGMTHEEIISSIARNEVRSYKQLPQIWYQIQTKFRDEPRPKSGLLRLRQFTMKDSYSLDVDYAGLDVSYEKHRGAYCRIYERCGLDYLVIQASSGAMGGSESAEFVVRTDAGEDMTVSCKCGYASNLEKATSALEPIEDPSGEPAPEKISTPGQKTIANLTAFLGLPENRQMKSLVYVAENKPVLVLVRGDHQASEAKLAAALGTDLFRAATAEEIVRDFGAAPGSLGPVGLKKVRIIADGALKGRRDLLTGANQDDFHLMHVTPGRDFTAEFADVREVRAGDPCVQCGRPLDVLKCLEVGHIFKLGTRYSDSMGVRVLDQQGREVPVVMGSYGIGLERILAAAIEQYADSDGISWPASIAPFHVVITLVSRRDEKQTKTAEQLYEQLAAAGIETLLDDRDERPGVKFKDADLVGIPYRITVGKKIEQGVVELYDRRARQQTEMPLDQVVAAVSGRLNR